MILEIQEHYHEEITWVFGEGDHERKSDKGNKEGGRGR
jgi:hypothetical protein